MIGIMIEKDKIVNNMPSIIIIRLLFSNLSIWLIKNFLKDKAIFSLPSRKSPSPFT